jgi:AcrR family transcriptional regulator
MIWRVAMRSLDIGATLDHQKTIARILDGAERLFRHYGAGKTTVTDIARELEMSAANIYRFFASKAEIQQAICNRIFGERLAQARATAKRRITATERLQRCCLDLHRMTISTLTHDEKVHEMLILAIECHWSVIERHLGQLNEVVASIIADGIEAGEFRRQDPASAARCFNTTIVSLYHPKLVSLCTARHMRAEPEALVAFAIRALAR